MPSSPRSIAGGLFVHVACWLMCVLFYFSFVCLHVCAYAFKSKVHCESALGPSASRLPYYCTPLVCIPAVIGGLAVWRHNENNCAPRRRGHKTITANWACMKALSKTLPNMHGSSHVPAQRLTFTSSCWRHWLNFSTVPNGRFFFKIIRPNSSLGTPEGSLCFGVRNTSWFWLRGWLICQGAITELRAYSEIHLHIRKATKRISIKNRKSKSDCSPLQV